MRYSQIFAGLLLLSVLVGLSGCFSAKPDDIEAFLRPPDAFVTADDYILTPPDEVMVTSSKIPELMGTTRFTLVLGLAGAGFEPATFGL